MTTTSFEYRPQNSLESEVQIRRRGFGFGFVLGFNLRILNFKSHKKVRKQNKLQDSNLLMYKLDDHLHFSDK